MAKNRTLTFFAAVALLTIASKRPAPGAKKEGGGCG